MVLQQTLRSIPHRSLSLNRGSGRISKHGLNFLNGAQFLGAMNDNLFKFLNIYLLIDYYGAASSADVLLLVGISYVAPFLLFSSAAGILADRFSKQKFIVLLKIVEIIIIGASFFVFNAKAPLGCYSLVFLLSLHSALMGPPKYSIIPELVKEDAISKANGLITSSTYLAIIVGTFLASFLAQISGKNFIFCTTFCFIAAVLGLVFALYIPHTEPKRTQRKMRANFILETHKTLKICRKTPFLTLAVYGSAFFLFLGAFFQLNVIPFAIENLGLTEIGGGYLFLAIAIGIAVGSVIAGKMSKKGVQLGLSCIASLGLALILFFLPWISSTFVAAIALALLGIFGGLYIIPFESYMQTISSSDTRGQVIAAENVLSFLGVLLAPLCLFFFSKVLGVSAAFGFAVIGALTLVISSMIILRMSGVCAQYFSRTCLQPFFQMHLIRSPFHFKEAKVALWATQLKKKEVALLLGESSSIHVFVVKERHQAKDRWLNRLSNIDFLYFRENSEAEMASVVEKALALQKQPLLLFSSKAALVHFQQSAYYHLLKEEYGYQFRNVSIKHTSHFKPSLLQFWKRTQITFLFENKQFLASSLAKETPVGAL